MGTAIGDLVEKKEVSFDSLKGRVLGIDSYNICYQFLSSIRGPDGAPLMDSNGKITSHLTGLLYRTTNLVLKGLKPVFIFDGKPSELKGKTLQKRNAIRTDAKKQHEKALKEGDFEKARSMAKRSSKLTKEMVGEAKELLQLMGLPVVQAPSEGEAQIAAMVSSGAIYGAVTQDYDALLFGAKRVFRNVAVTGKRKVPGKNIYIDVKPTVMELDSILKQLDISRQKLIWIGILIGTDFNEKFPRIGPKTALKLVKKYNSFEKIIEETGHEPDFDYREIEDIFMNPVATTEFDLSFGKPDKEKAIDFLVNKHDFSEDRVGNVLSKLSEKLDEKGQQSNLSKWF